MILQDTIAAISTPPGTGAISVVRLSGRDALIIANKFFTGNVLSYASHTAHLGKIVSKTGEIIDEVLLLVMHEGRSYTGENSVEIMCHGSPLITQKILARAFEEGARAAGPGEFSLRAFKSGSIDLAQAEAIQELIAAKNEEALKAASQQLEGRLSLYIKDLQTCITDVTAIIEAWVDYPEEGLEFATTSEIIEMLTATRVKMEKLQSTFHDGARLSNGTTLCLLGAPNVGKSSLMNALLNYDRAIVTPIAGTTRDVLQEDLFLGGMHFRLLDTAGIRDTEEVIEKEGILRSKRGANGADIVLLLFDLTRPLKQAEIDLINEFPHAIKIWNKIDLPHDSPPFDGISISAKSGLHLDLLKEVICQKVRREEGQDKEQIVLTKERHFSHISEAIKSVDQTILGLHDGTSPEFLAFDLRSALKELSQIIGTNVTEDILGAIFEKFCVGK